MPPELYHEPPVLFIENPNDTHGLLSPMWYLLLRPIETSFVFCKTRYLTALPGPTGADFSPAKDIKS